MRSLCLWAALGLAIGMTGCRSDGGDNPDGGTGVDGGGGDGGGGGPTIYDVQTPGGSHSTVGTPVDLSGVVVTAVDRFGGRTGGIYIQEPAGGAYSGVFVYNPTIAGGTIDDIQPGDVVDVTGGIVDEFALDTDTSGRTLTEIAPPQDGMVTVTRTGTGTIPAPADVDATTLACTPTDESGCAEAEKWEGVLIRVQNVAVTSAPRGVSGTDPTLAEMEITGPYRVSSALTALLTPAPENRPLYDRDACFASITGIGDYFFTYKMLPRSSADLVLAADMTGCLYEDSVAECHDTTDDDHDGFADCSDFSCQQADPAGCTSTTTIGEVQMPGGVPPGTLVRIENVVVTARASSLVWVQDPAGGQYSGVAVFPTTPPDATIVPGAVVTVEGNVTEYFDVTEIENAVLTVTGTQAPLAPEEIADPSGLVTMATAEPWEGVLIRIRDVPVSAAPDSFGEWTVGAYSLHIDNIMYTPTPAPAPGDCAVSVTGVLHYSFSNYKIEPRDTADVTLTPGVACP